MDDDELRDMAASACQEALSFGVSEDAFMKLARSVRERCAVAAWNHYMDTCRKTGRAPTIWHEWCASDAIRGA